MDMNVNVLTSCITFFCALAFTPCFCGLVSLWPLNDEALTFSWDAMDVEAWLWASFSLVTEGMQQVYFA